MTKRGQGWGLQTAMDQIQGTVHERLALLHISKDISDKLLDSRNKTLCVEKIGPPRWERGGGASSAKP